jgi:hypothetical protein
MSEAELVAVFAESFVGTVALGGIGFVALGLLLGRGWLLGVGIVLGLMALGFSGELGSL